MMTKLLDPKSDFIFRNIFGVDDRKPMLISFLNALFKGKPSIKSVSLEDTDMLRIDVSEPVSLNIKATTNEGKRLYIKIRSKAASEDPEKAVFYLSETVIETVRPWECEYRHVICVWILGGSITTDRKKVVSEAYWTLTQNGDEAPQIFSDCDRIVFIELQKFDPKSADKNDPLTAWLAFFKDPASLDASFLEVKEVNEALNTLRLISTDEDARVIAELRERTVDRT